MVDFLLKKYLKHILAVHLSQLNKIAETQRNLLQQIIEHNRATVYGENHQFSRIRNYEEFKERVPVIGYPQLEPFVKRIMKGENGVLTRQKVSWLIQTAGTSGNCKYIPATAAFFQAHHIKAGWTSLARVYQRFPDLVFRPHSNFMVGGTFYSLPDSLIPAADVSALLIQRMPAIAEYLITPSLNLLTKPNWEDKLDEVAEVVANNRMITICGGVPTWNMVLLKKVLRLKNAQAIHDLWPHFSVYIHGGVNFKPYRDYYRRLIGDKPFLFHEVYNASEGFFAAQSDGEESLQLMTHHACFYEFIPYENHLLQYKRAKALWEVEEGPSYALVITNNSGLYRYMPGDVVRFTKVSEAKIVVEGRLQEYINAFGEDLLGEQAEQALSDCCRKHKCLIHRFTIAPLYQTFSKPGSHQWFIEFEKAPELLPQFVQDLEQNVQALNFNYKQKRNSDMAMQSLQLVPLPSGFFQEYFKRKLRLGAQNKIPRLSNDRLLAEELLMLLREVKYNSTTHSREVE